jgi:glutathione S-transferase
MIVLHGFSASNYYNVVKHVLMYKGIPFEEDCRYGGGEEWLAISPVGKIPAITTDSGQVLSETTVICDYLEETYPDKPLYPSDPGSRASVRQIMKVAELYLELPNRRMLAYAFSGSPAPEAVKADINHFVNRGVGAMQRLCQFSPWIAGAEFTLADIYVHYVNAVAGWICLEHLDRDLLAEIEGMKDWTRSMKSSDIAQSVDADRTANMPEFQAYIQDFMSGQKK